MDEIDAALDVKNVSIVGHYIKVTFIDLLINSYNHHVIVF